MREAPASDGPVIGNLERGRHVDLEGRAPSRLIRWLLLAVLLAAVILALLDVFGQRSTTTTATANAASLEVLSPPRLRPGLLFQTRITVRAYKKLKQPTLVLDRGWFEAMTFNGATPDPPNWAAAPDGKIDLQYDKLGAGDTLVVWISWQVNPPNAAHRSQSVVLEDGNKPIARVNRKLTVFP